MILIEETLKEAGVNRDLFTFLQSYIPIAQESAIWGNGTIPLEITSYLSQELPPLDLITSVRALVIGSNQVLVVRDPGGYHLLPGGRRETGETLLQTLRRELLEETGWLLSNITLIGFKYFRHLDPNTTFPDFLQIVYTGRPEAFYPEAREQNSYEIEAIFRPYAELSTLSLTASDLAFLDAAQRVRSRA